MGVSRDHTFALGVVIPLAHIRSIIHDTIRYDTMRKKEFNVDSKAE